MLRGCFLGGGGYYSWCCRVLVPMGGRWVTILAGGVIGGGGVHDIRGMLVSLVW